jgi:hypothetical protein
VSGKGVGAALARIVTGMLPIPETTGGFDDLSARAAFPPDAETGSHETRSSGDKENKRPFLKPPVLLISLCDFLG